MNSSIAPDTQPPSTPTNLAASVTGSQVNLSWTPSTDNVAVTGYLIERQNPGTSSFTQIGTSTGASFSDIGVPVGTNSYRVRATDAAGNLSPYSNVVQASVVFAISPRTVTMTPTQTEQFTANASSVIWSVDGVVGGSATSGTITTYGPVHAPIRRRHSHRDGDHVRPAVHR